MSVSESWPADKVERWPTDRLVPYVRNARTHSDAQIAQIAGSIREWGWTMPVLADETGGLIAGHCRVLAARKLGLTEIPVMVANGWTEAQKRAYVIADNKLTLNAGWDADILKVELTDLKDMGADLSLVGFSEDELADLLADRNAGLTDPDEVPEPLPEPVSALGDVWVLGRHRLVCGDCTNPKEAQVAWGDSGLDVLLTDPPYCSGGFQESGKTAGSIGTRRTETIANDAISTRGYMALMKAAISECRANVVYMFTDWRMWISLFDVMESSGYRIRNMIVWDKGNPGMGAGWRMQHELIMCGICDKFSFDPKDSRGNVIQSKRTGNVNHPTEKPVDLLEAIIGVTDAARTIGDPFCGSGSTIIASEMTGRCCRAIEINPVYVDVSIRRWQSFAGQTAKLEATGQTFAETAQQRAVACQTEPNAAAA